MTLAVDVPRALAPLLKPARYKVARGGRGGAKSHFFAEQLLLRCVMKRTRAVCIREVQNSIKESVKQLLVDKIIKLGLGDVFDVLESEIRGPHNSLIIFKGMQSYNADNIKSLEGYDIAWWEEAQTASARSLRLLRPTMRRDGSELWFSYNRRHDTDPVDVMFSGANIPADAIVVDVGWQDNPWFPEVLRKEMLHDYAVDPDMAEHVWGGDYERVTDAAYYARWIATAEKEGRIGHFPYRPGLPVHTSWDIGVDDYTAIWFWQEDGKTVTALDYYETQNDGAEQIVRDALPEYCANVREGAAKLIELDRDPWVFGNHYFPHDVKVREWGAGARSRVETLMGLGLRNIVKGAALGPEERVNASRLMLPITRFHATKRTMIGVSRLRRYSRKLNEQMNQFQGPLKDGNDHGCLEAGSLVRMADNSYCAVEAVKIGDLVWTPSGISRILNAGPVGVSRRMVRIETGCGKVLRCTPDHKVMSQRGFVPALSLKATDRIWTGQEWPIRLSSLCSKAADTGFRAHITAAMARSCTAKSTASSVVRFLDCITSTIWTAARSTIVRLTSQLSLAPSILAFTASSNTSGGEIGNCPTPLAPQRPSGTSPKPGLSGIASTALKPSRLARFIRSSVRTAAQSLSRFGLIAPSSALSIASITLEPEQKAGELVFDLTVENHACYQANGILVSNSDAFGEYAVNCPLTNIPEPKAKKPWVLQGGVRLGPPKETRGRKRV